ncbi:hypothetical protein HK100_005727 [Physocladia obscura]|uniref:Uncharacterized protein n=1 Tax=Physocladia obscura TaxID=109957 RepID=A0AAD5SRC6_9FUNG|nr:hypothetical protein HK100_005727 [Physocladia obscura]
MPTKLAPLSACITTTYKPLTIRLLSTSHINRAVCVYPGLSKATPMHSPKNTVYHYATGFCTTTAFLITVFLIRRDALIMCESTVESKPNATTSQTSATDISRRFSSPIFQGIPVAATLLMHQAAKIFDAQFAGILEMSPVFLLPEFVPPSDIYAKSFAERAVESALASSTRATNEVASVENEFGYQESGGFFGSWATAVEVKVPVFEKLPEEEESRLGSAGIRKKPVGSLIMKGKCTYGCAVVKLMNLQVRKLDGDLVWEKQIK